MATYIDESSELPSLVILRPVFNSSQTVIALSCQANYVLRTVNQSDNSKIILQDTKSFSFDMLNANAAKTVNIAGIGNIRYDQIAMALKKMTDAERALISP